MAEIRLQTVEDMRRYAAHFTDKRIAAAPSARPRALVVGLYGDLGSGKTTFMQGVAAALGVGETVTSPTFVLSKIYKISPRRGFTHLVHMDAYRLDGPQELAPLGWHEVVADPRNIVMVEWAERIERALPDDCARLRFSVISGDGRAIKESP